MSRNLIIDGRPIGDEEHSYVIAEIGGNHQGSLERCKELFASAKQCGVDAVKLQKRDNRSLYTEAFYDSPYHSEHAFGDTYGSHREALEFGLSEWKELQDYCKEIRVSLFATAWDFKSVDFLAKIDVPAYKVASGDLKSTPLLKYIAEVGKPMIISTGGATMDDVQRAVDTIAPINSQLCILQCTAAYPCDAEKMNLRVIETFRQTYPNYVIGLSDHQDGIAMSILAYAMGARVFEKHFTLHRSWKGSDQAFSLEPSGMGRMVRDLRRAHVARGDGVKAPLPEEVKPLEKMGKKIVPARCLTAGHVLTMADLALKSPGGGIPPYEIEKVVGKTLTRPLEMDEELKWEHLN